MRLRPVAGPVACLLCVLASSGQSPSATAQRDAPEPATSYGTVSGHITVAGSNAPARFAAVALQPIEVKANEPPVPGKRPSMTFSVYETGLDGGYTIQRVAPGKYYLVVTQPGFLSPFDQFTHAELEHPSGPVQQRIDAVLPVVLVRANATSTFDLQLRRGADLSGTVRFDDGTPFAGASIFLSRRDADGKWVSARSNQRTDTGDDGRWHISGLSEGEYRVGVGMNLVDRKQSSLLTENSFMTVRSRFSLTVYAGDTTRERDAKTVILTEGQDAGGQDITIPVARLHALSGSVVDSRTGQAVNAGKIDLVYADDGKRVTSADIDADTGVFNFSFVPEGEYKLVVKNAREVRRETATSDDFFAAPAKETVLREYAPGELPLTVAAADQSAITLPVEERPAGGKSKAAAGPASQ